MKHRCQAAKKRICRLKWGRSIGGDAKAVARSGVTPSVTYGACATGIPPSVMWRLRRAQAIGTKIQCGGSSTIARLALAGPRGEDWDLAVTHCNLPLLAVAAKLWDDKQCRLSLTRTWIHAKTELTVTPLQKWWGMFRGPVGAAVILLWQIGGDWVKPFVVRFLDREVNLLDVPPKQVALVLRAHARRIVDLKLLDSLCAKMQWCRQSVLTRYAHGMDWDWLRRCIWANSCDLTVAEKSALLVVACGGSWDDERLWLAGYRGHGTCDGCLEAIGDARHCLHDCGRLQMELLQHRAAGRIGRVAGARWGDGWEQLLVRRLPPKGRVLVSDGGGSR